MKAGALRTGLLGGVLIMLVAGIYATKHAREAEWKEKYARSVKRTAALTALDPLNPQIAARLAARLGRGARYDKGRRALMRAQLERIVASPTLSRDVYEVVSKSLG